MISKTKTSFVKSSRNTKSAGNVFMTIKKKKIRSRTVNQGEKILLWHERHLQISASQQRGTGDGGGGRVATKAHVCNIKTIWNHTRNPQQEYNKVVAISRGEGMFNKGHPIYGAKKKKKKYLRFYLIIRKKKKPWLPQFKERLLYLNPWMLRQVQHNHSST